MKGFTLVELVVTMTLVVLLVGSGVTITLKNINTQKANTAQDRMITMLRQARSAAQSGRLDKSVCGASIFNGWIVTTASDGMSYTIAGSCGVTTFGTIGVTLPSGITVSPSSSVTFKPLNQGTNAVGSMVFVLSGFGTTRSVSVTDTAQIVADPIPTATPTTVPTATPTATVTPSPTPSSCTPIIVDNATAGASGSGASFTGTWCASGAAGSYGNASLYSCGAGADTYRFTPTIPTTGQYDVWVRWTSNTNRSTTTPITLNFASGSTAINFNQQINGGVWNYYGSYTFNAGTAGYVQIAESGAGGEASSDGAEFIPVSCSGATATPIPTQTPTLAPTLTPTLTPTPTLALIPNIAWWKMNENTLTTTYDSTVNGNTGTLSSGATWTSGKTGSGINTTGNGYVNAGSGASMDDLPALTVSAWVNIRSISSLYNPRLVVKANGSNTSGWTFQLVPNGGNGRLRFLVDYSGTDLVRDSAAGIFTFNTWQHVVVTWDGTALQSGVHFYLNGVETAYQVNADGTTSRVSDAASNLSISDRQAGPGVGFDGIIDDVRIYNYALTPAQVTTVYNQ